MGAVQHVNLGPVDGHGCTAMFIQSGNPSAVYKIDDIWGFNDSGLCTYVATYPWIVLSLGANSVTLSNVFLDGNWITYRSNGPPGCQGCSPAVALSVNGAGATGTMYYKNDVFAHFSGRTISGGGGNGFNVYMDNVVIDGWVSSSLNGHTEWWVPPGGAVWNEGDWKLSNSLILQEAGYIGPNGVVGGANSFGPGPIFLATNGVVNYNDFSITNTTDINAFLGFASQTSVISGCVGGSIDSNGACTSIGNNFYLTHVTSGTFGPGSIYLCANETATIGGTILNGDSFKVTFTSSAITGSPVSITVPVGTSDTLTTLATALAAGINGNAALRAAGIYAQSSAAVVTMAQRWSLSPQAAYSRTSGSNATVTLATPGGGTNNISMTEQIGGSGPGYLSVWRFDGASLHAPDSNILCTIINVTSSAQIADAALGTFNTGAHMNSITLVNNQFDVASKQGFPSANPFIYNFGGIPSSSGSVTGTMTGTTTLTTSASISLLVGQAIYNAAFGGSCTTSNYGGCPTVVSGSGTSYVLSAAETMSASPFTIVGVQTCSIPAVVSGGTDLTGLLPAGYLNIAPVNGATISGC